MVAPMASSPRRCRSTGRLPIAQPPGKDTRARPKRATIGPSTSTDARMVLTSSYGAVNSLMVLACTSTLSFSSITTSTPMLRSNAIMVVMSLRCGTLRTVIGQSDSSVAARIGSAEFFAPEIRISPWSGTPPRISSFSMDNLKYESICEGPLCSARPGSAVQPLPFFRRQRFHVDCVDRSIGNFGLQSRINQLLFFDGRQPLEHIANHEHIEVATVTGHFHLAGGQTAEQQLFDLGGFHGDTNLESNGRLFYGMRRDAGYASLPGLWRDWRRQVAPGHATGSRFSRPLTRTRACISAGIWAIRACLPQAPAVRNQSSNRARPALELYCTSARSSVNCCGASPLIHCAPLACRPSTDSASSTPDTASTAPVGRTAVSIMVSRPLRLWHPLSRPARHASWR